MWPLSPRYQARLVASWHGWHLWEVAPEGYVATHGARHFSLKGERDRVLLEFCARCREEGRAP
jgi:hypothetical protein